MKKSTFLLLFLYIIAIKTYSQYYVSKSGSDINSGSILQPFKTIQHAANIMNAGDICYIMAGIYREEVIPANNGNSLKSIVFKNFKNDKVLISGTNPVSQWQKYKKGIYKAYIPDTVLQVLFDTTLANEASYPNLSANHLSSKGWANLTMDSIGNTSFAGTNFPENYWVGGYCVNLVGKRWVAHNGIIDSSNGNMVHCSKRSTPWNKTTGITYLGNGKGHITNHLNALDTINEWFWQNDTLYYFPQDSTFINNSKLEARTRMYGFNCSGKEYIEIQNLNFVCASVNFENAKSCVLKKSNVLYPTPYFYYSKSWDRQNASISDFEISTWTGKGIAVSGSDNLIKQCYVAHSWGDGISIGGLNNTVDSCLVEDCNWSATDDAPVTTIGKGHVITHNTLRHAARGILVHRMTSRAIISYNHLYDCGILNDDLGLTYSYKTNGDSTVISYNWVHDNHATGKVPGIYLDAWDTAYIVHHNVVWNCFGGIRTNLSAVNHQIYNNTFWVNNWSILTNVKYDLVNQIVKNNLCNKPYTVYNIDTKDLITYTIESNNLIADSSGFTNISKYDFTLKPSSPAINYGVHISGITDNYMGIAPDAGAYEFGAKRWIPGTNVKIVTLSNLLY